MGKRFLVFANNNYYPAGGWYDYQGSADSLNEARQLAGQALSSKDIEWAHIVDTEINKIVERSGDSGYGQPDMPRDPCPTCGHRCCPYRGDNRWWHAGAERSQPCARCVDHEPGRDPMSAD